MNNSKIPTLQRICKTHITPIKLFYYFRTVPSLILLCLNQIETIDEIIPDLHSKYNFIKFVSNEPLYNEIIESAPPYLSDKYKIIKKAYDSILDGLILKKNREQLENTKIE